MVLYILNRDEELMTVLHNDSELDGIQHCELVEDLSEISTLNFEVSGDTEGLEHLQEECHVLTQNLAGRWKLFTVKHITDIHNSATCKRVEAEDVITELGDYVVGTNYQGKTIEPKKVVADLLKGTGFAVGEVSGDFLSTAIDVDTRYMSKLALLQHIASLGNAYLFTDINIEGTEIVSVTVSIKQANKDIGRRFEFDSELVELQRENDSTTIKTAILPLGAVKEQTAEEQEAGVPAEYVKITDVSWTTSAGKPVDKPAGQDYIEDVEATAKYGNTASDGTKKPRVVVMQFSEITDPEVLATRAYMELQALTAPKTNYSFSANDLSGYLATQDIMDEPVEVGDVCYVIDNSVNPPIVEEVIVRRIAGNPDRPEALNIEIGTPQATLVDSDITGSGLNHYGAGGSSSSNGSFVNITANTANIDTLKVRNAQVLNQLDSDKITVGTISGDTASFDTLIVDSLNVTEALMNKANIADLHAINATINTLKADVAYVTDLNVVTGKVEALEGKTATFENILAGNITADNMQAGAITAGSGVIADGAIGSAQISDLDASKLTAGTIDTTKVEIAGADGHLQLKGNRLQVFQGTGGKAVERVSIGDVNNDGSVYGLRVRGADGVTVLLDENGVKSEGITDGSITNDKISGDANIDGSKLNINSVITEINEEGTTTIAGNKITVDGTTLDTKLYTITEAQGDMSNTIEQHATSISANEKAIKAKVDSQTYTTDMQGLNSKLNKNTTAISALQGEIALKVEQSDIETAKDDMGQIIDSKIADAKASIEVTTDGISQSVSNLNNVVSNKADGSTVTAIDNKVASLNTTLNGISGKVSTLETTTATLGNNVNGLQGSVNTLDQSVASLQLTTEGMSSTVNTLKTNQQTLTQKVTSVEGAVSTVEKNLSTTSNKVSTIENNLDSITQRVATTETTTTTLNSKIDGIQIGGRNLLLNSGFTKGLNYWLTFKTSNAQVVADSSALSGYAVKFTSTGGGIYQRKGEASNNITTYPDGSVMTVSGYVKSSVANKILRPNFEHAGLNTSKDVKCINANTWYYFTHTYTINSHTVNSSGFSTVTFYGDSGADYYLKDVVLEYGNKASTWTPAPEDIDSALSSKANSSDVYTKTEVYTKAQTDSAIKVAKDEINLGVSQTYETKANVETKVNNAINNVQVGGRNIFRYSGNFGTSVGSYWTNNGGGLTFDSSIKYNGYNTIKTTVGTGITGIWYKLEPNVEYTYSALVRCNTEFSGNGGIPLHYWAGKDNVHQSKISIIKYDTLYRTPNKWKLIYITFKLTDDADSFKPFIYWGSTTSFQFNIAYMKLEKGNKPSDWSPAPEDVDSNISSLDSKITTTNNKVAELNVNLNGITQKVSSTETNVTNLQGKIDIDQSKVSGELLPQGYKANDGKGYFVNVGEPAKLAYEANKIKLKNKIWLATDFIRVDSSRAIHWFIEGTVSSNNQFYFGIERFDKNKQPVNGLENSGTIYFIDRPFTGQRKGVFNNDRKDTAYIRLRILNDWQGAGDSATAEISYMSLEQNSVSLASEVTNLQNRMSTAESKITSNAIINTVSSTINTAKQEAINSANSATDNKLKGYATTSSLTQTTNSITAKFETSGGYNLLRNSGFKNGNSYWSVWHHNNPTGGVFEHVLSSDYWGYPDASVEAAQIRLSNQSNIEYGIAQNFNTTIGKQYTLTFQYAGHRISGANAIIRGANGSWLAHKYFTPTDFGGGSDNVNKWGTFSLTFTATATSHALNIVINAAQNDGHLWVAKPQIIEGTVALPYSPHPSEIYEGSTIIDATGVTVNNGALRVKNNAGTTVLSGDSAGNLMLTGTIKSEAGNGQYVALNSGGITFRDSQKSEEVLRLNTSSSTSNRDINGVTFAMPQYADYLSFRHIAKPSLENGWEGGVAHYTFMDMWSTDFNDANGNKQYKGVNVYAPTYLSQKIRFRNGGDQYLHEVTPNITWNNMNKLMGVYGDNGTVLGYKAGDNLQARIVVTEGNHPGTADVIRSWGHWNCSGAIVHNATFRGSFVNSYANTATRTVSNTASVMAEGNQVRVNFENVQIKDGKAILSIPKRYRGINDGYIVSSIVKKGRGDVWVAQEHEDRFTIEGEQDIAVNVEVIIKLTEAVVAKTVREDEQLCIEVPNGETSNAI